MKVIAKGEENNNNKKMEEEEEEEENFIIMVNFVISISIIIHVSIIIIVTEEKNNNRGAIKIKGRQGEDPLGVCAIAYGRLSGGLNPSLIRRQKAFASVRILRIIDDCAHVACSTTQRGEECTERRQHNQNPPHHYTRG